MFSLGSRRLHVHQAVCTILITFCNLHNWSELNWTATKVHSWKYYVLGLRSKQQKNYWTSNRRSTYGCLPDLKLNAINEHLFSSRRDPGSMPLQKVHQKPNIFSFKRIWKWKNLIEILLAGFDSPLDLDFVLWFIASYGMRNDWFVNCELQ